MNYVDVFYRSDDGLRLYARDYPGPDRDAPAILCLPGLTRNSKDFAILAETLRATYRVICADQRGRGRSERDTDASRYHPGRYVADMHTLLNVLGISRVALIGTSLGGLMAMIMLTTDSARVRATVINDIGPEVDPQGLARIAGYVGKTAPVGDWDAATKLTAQVNGIAFPDYQQADWQAMARDLFVQEETTPILDYDPAIALGVASGSTAPTLWPQFEQTGKKPMLVIRGETSDILSADTLAEMARRHPALVTQVIAGRGHAPTLSEPDAHGAIIKFLGDIAAMR